MCGIRRRWRRPRGTMMVAFDEHPEEVRWGLVGVVQDLCARQGE